MDRQLHPFTALRATGVADDGGDKAFDDEPLPTPALRQAPPEDGDMGNEAVRRSVIPIAVS
jgi:tRNA 2-thiocytidine biosynthesis protein TtcA